MNYSLQDERDKLKKQLQSEVDAIDDRSILHEQ